MNILRKNKQADSLTLDELVDRYYESIYRHVRRLVVSHDDACDVCQETFMRAVSSFESLRNPDAAKAWLYRIATNEAMRMLSSRRLVDEQISAKLVDQLADEVSDNEPDPRLLRFNRAILTLTQAQRAIFNLRHYDEMSYNEIAEVVGGSPDTIRVVYHHAKEKIKKYILSHQ